MSPQRGNSANSASSARVRRAHSYASGAIAMQCLRVYRLAPRCACRGQPWARSISAPASRASKTPRCSPAAAASSTTSSSRAASKPASCAARTRTPASARSTPRRRARCRACTPCSRPTICRRAWRPARSRCWCPIPSIKTPRTQLALARDEVCYVGQTIAVVIADNRYLAEDAAAAVAIDFEVLPAVSDCRDAAKPGAPRVHSDLAEQHRGLRADELRRRRCGLRATPRTCSRTRCSCIAAAP